MVHNIAKMSLVKHARINSADAPLEGAADNGFVALVPTYFAQYYHRAEHLECKAPERAP